MKLNVIVEAAAINRLQKYSALITQGLNGAPGPIQDAVLRWGARYMGAMRERFNIYSKGGGDWAELKRSTLMARLRRPISRLRKALAAGDITQEQFQKRLAGARSRVRKARKQFEAGKATFAILRDTGTLFGALDPTLTAPGSFRELIHGGVRVGIGGPMGHPSGRATIAQIASYHQDGGPSLPQRKIIVRPPPEVIKAMVADMKRGVRRAARDAGLA